MTRRTKALLSILAALLVLAALWSYRYVASQRDASRRAQADAADCRRMAHEIRQFSRRPTLAAERERLAAETTGLIEKAAASAHVPAGSLNRITPEPPRRVGDTVYKEKPTRVLLRNVTLRQLATLTHHLIAADAGLHARSIRITAPRRDPTGDHWTAELLLTYLIYDPPRSQR